MKTQREWVEVRHPTVGVQDVLNASQKDSVSSLRASGQRQLCSLSLQPLWTLIWGGYGVPDRKSASVISCEMWPLTALVVDRICHSNSLIQYKTLSPFLFSLRSFVSSPLFFSYSFWYLLPVDICLHDFFVLHLDDCFACFMTSLETA